MKNLRRAVFWAHLVAGITAGLVILTMSATGVLLTYERQLTAWADKYNANIAVEAGADPLSASELLAHLGAIGISEKPSSITFRNDPAAPVEVSFGRERDILLNPYDGTKLADGQPGLRGFFRGTRDVHRWLALSGEGRTVGRVITGVSNLAFLFLVTSGFFLWWPRNWTLGSLRNVVWFRRGIAGKARDFNWHNTIGFWCCVPLFVVVLSGVVISFPWASSLVYKMAGEKPPARRHAAPAREKSSHSDDAKSQQTIAMAELDSWMDQAQSATRDWESITVNIPDASDETVEFTIDEGSGGQPHKKTKLSFVSGAIGPDEVETFATNSLGSRIRSYLRFAHTGEVFGLLGQTIAGLASAGAMLLVWTGFALGWRRFRSRKRQAYIDQTEVAAAQD